MSQSTSPRLNLVTSPFKLKGTSLPATLLQPQVPQLHLLEQELNKRLQQGGALLTTAPLLLDLSNPGFAFDLSGFASLCEQLAIPLVALRTDDLAVQAEAKKLGLVVLSASAPSAAAANEDLAPVARVHEGAVRSGQQLVNEKGSLIIQGSVNPGAEVLASGNIHVYGALRGRALAGIHGDEQARVYCLALDAELVAIAGRYQSGLTQASGTASVLALEDDRLVVQCLSANPS